MTEQRSGTLYRLYDAKGECIYIGASMNGATRIPSHRDKPWWTEVARAELTHFPSREQAAEAEKSALAGDLPRHNKVRPKTVVSDDELAERRERRRHEAEKRRVELEERERLIATIPGLHCSNCTWNSGRIHKGKVIAETPCPTCGCKTLVIKRFERAAA